MRTLCFTLVMCLLTAFWPGSICAQTARSGSSTAQSIGSSIADAATGLSSSVPALQQAQSLRDTATRGSFVGAESGDVPGLLGSGEATGGQQGSRRLNMGSSQVRQPGSQRGRSSAYGRQSTTSVQPTLTLGFAPPTASPAEIFRRASEAVHRAAQYSSVGVRVEGGHVVLEGTVRSRHERALVAQLIALEPGVTKVENRLVVTSGETRAQ